MAYNNQPQVGFVMPNPGQPHPDQQQHQYPQQPVSQGYPQYPAQPGGYPPTQQGYPQPKPQVHQQQPGPFNVGQQDLSWFHCSNYLRNATSFNVKQKAELLEALVGWETGNKYTVKDQAGNKVFYVGEDSGCLVRQCCESRRPVTLAVKDNTGNDVMFLNRPVDCSLCCGLFCADSITASTSSGQMLGSVVQEFSLLYPQFQIRDASSRTVLRIEGPLCPMSFGKCSGNVVFKVMNLSGAVVGTISKQWSGLVRELFTDADSFSMTFPGDLDPALKAVCLAALFLIDYEYFESGENSHNYC